VGFFGRKKRPHEPEEQDVALPVLSCSEARLLRILARDAFARHGREVTVFADHVEDVHGATFGLDGLSRTLLTQPVERRCWAQVVDDHVSRLLAAIDGPDEFAAPLAELLSRTYLRLYDRSTLPEGGPWTYGRELAPGILELVALDCPETVTVYPDARVAEHGLATLRRAGLANLRRVRADERTEVRGVQVLGGESVYLASTVLLLPEVVLRTTGEARLDRGVLVAMPCRDQLLYHVPRDHGVLDALSTMAGLAADRYTDSAGAISPHVQWWRDGKFEPLTEPAPGGRTKIVIGEEFGAVLGALLRESGAG
jgi:hypothetical protein